jgi:hypothetical protein
VPGRFAKSGIAVRIESGVAGRAIAIQQIGRRGGRRSNQPERRLRVIDGDRRAGDVLEEEVKPRHIINVIAAVGSKAQFLAELSLIVRNMLQALDRNAGIVAVIGGIPVPEAPGAD